MRVQAKDFASRSKRELRDRQTNAAKPAMRSARSANDSGKLGSGRPKTSTSPANSGTMEGGQALAPNKPRGEARRDDREGRSDNTII